MGVRARVCVSVHAHAHDCVETARPAKGMYAYLDVFAALLHGDESPTNLAYQSLFAVGHQLQTGVLGDHGRIIPGHAHRGGERGTPHMESVAICTQPSAHSCLMTGIQ